MTLVDLVIALAGSVVLMVDGDSSGIGLFFAKCLVSSGCHEGLYSVADRLYDGQ